MKKHWMKRGLALALTLVLLCGVSAGALADGEEPVFTAEDEPVLILPMPPESLDDWLDGWEGEDIVWVPELSVQLNGEYVLFPDARPEITDDRTMVPFRAMAEALGFEVGYLDGGVTAAGEAGTITFTVGEPEYVFTDGEGSVTGTMDTAPYIKEERTYVPLRFFAEAFGLQVLWDGDTRTAVVYDREALVQEIDARFTVVNSWLAAQQGQELPELLRMVETVSCTYTELNSIDGDSSATVTARLELVTGGGSLSMTLDMDLSQLLALIFAGDFPAEDEELLAQMETLLSGLKKPGIDLIYNAPEGKLYFHSPELVDLLAALDEMEGEETEMDLSGLTNAWFMVELPLEELLGTAYAEVQAIPAGTVGELVMLGAESYGSYLPEYVCPYAQTTADSLAELLGDQLFVRSGSRCTAKYDFSADPSGEGINNELYWNDVKYLKGSLSLDTATGAVSADLETRMYDYYSELDTLCTLKLDLSSAGGSLELMVHEQNTFILELRMKASLYALSSAPDFRPPEDAVIIDLSAWLA